MTRRAIEIVDLGFGDSGKGTLTDYFVRWERADSIVRFNGGPQAGHNVVLPDGRHHTFSQFGSGSFLPQVRTLLSHFVLIEPYAMLNEAAHLESLHVNDVLGRTLIDERCLVITPPQQIANRVRERARGNAPHGTCGMGVGECVADSLERPDACLRASDLRSRATAGRKLRALLELKRSDIAAIRDSATGEELRIFQSDKWIEVALDKYAQIAERTNIVSQDQARNFLSQTACCVFEGAQGVLLDQHYGFFPYNTWSTTTFANADALLDDAGSDLERHRIGVIRTYMTRHGPGPFVTCDPTLERLLPESHNGELGWQGRFRMGVLDLVMLRYALRACGGVSALGVTHVDRLPALPPLVCDGYEIDGEFCNSIAVSSAVGSGHSELCRQLLRARPRHRPWPSQDAAAFISQLESALDSAVCVRSAGPTYLDKQ